MMRKPNKDYYKSIDTFNKKTPAKKLNGRFVLKVLETWQYTSVVLHFDGQMLLDVTQIGSGFKLKWRLNVKDGGEWTNVFLPTDCGDIL
jgi:hypothetical protein